MCVCVCVCASACNVALAHLAHVPHLSLRACRDAAMALFRASISLEPRAPAARLIRFCRPLPPT